ncbi:MAG: succinate dehydrogenase cytochrome b558 subunit [Planctomycetaceae bacterium]|nr:succinate dehydrogenase cytochrome b558 subunit [Planctomycetales bacterium]MCB9921203.1 succinate dehydrogenase cytochrome b558 subunit [Planctomycetaceae bacterium]
MDTNSSFLARHEFLIRRLHSLSGLIPVGAYMCVHLVTNASVLDSSATFQRAVYQIHSLGSILPLVEWLFIFAPILFHGIVGVVIIRGGLPNYGSYKYTSNLRYTLQRATGMIAFVFIMWHVFQMHGWFHFDAWLEGVAAPLGGAQFSPYNAASSLGAAMRGVAVPLLYAVGVLSCVFHLANGIWTMGITWGVWVSAAAQRRADLVCAAFGIALAVVGLSAIGGAVRIGNNDAAYEEAVEVEDKMWTAKTESGEIDPEKALHKRSHTSDGHASAD